MPNYLVSFLLACIHVFDILCVGVVIVGIDKVMLVYYDRVFVDSVVNAVDACV